MKDKVEKSPEHQRYLCLATNAEKCTLEPVQLPLLGSSQILVENQGLITQD